MALGHNVKFLRMRLSESYETVGQAVGTTAQNISQMEKRNAKRSEYSAALARHFGVHHDLLLEEWKFAGDTPEQIFAAVIAESRKRQHVNVAPGPDIAGLVPLISWVRAGSWDDANDMFQPGDAEDWLPYPKKAGVSRVYALKVRGDSMFNPAGPKSYPEGSTIFVDPEKKSPINGERIIAKLSGSSEVTFKVYMSDAGRTWLRALNPNYPPVHEEFKVLGTVVGKWEDE